MASSVRLVFIVNVDTIDAYVTLAITQVGSRVIVPAISWLLNGKEGLCKNHRCVSSRSFSYHRGLMYIWVAGSAFFCTFVALYIWYQLLRSSQLPLQLTFSSNLSHRADNQSAASSHHARDDVTIRKSVARISVYCVTPIICQFFMMALDVALYVDREQQWWFMNYMLFLAYLFSGLQVCH